MGYEVLLVVSYTVISLVVGLAWVAGYLDPYQAKLQEIVLDLMGENKASYGLKSMTLTCELETSILLIRRQAV